MSLVRPSDRLQLPETLQTQLYDFRKLVWTIKMIEAVCGAVAYDRTGSPYCVKVEG